LAGGVFLIQTDGQLVEMSEEKYGSEADFQELLAKYPNYLAGNQINDANPRKWLLIAREAALPIEESGSDRWSVDHLFLDQDAITRRSNVFLSTFRDASSLRMLLETLDWVVEEIKSF